MVSPPPAPGEERGNGNDNHGDDEDGNDNDDGGDEFVDNGDEYGEGDEEAEIFINRMVSWGSVEISQL